MEDSWSFSCINAIAKYHEKRPVKNNQPDFEDKAGNNDEYKVIGIWNSAIFAKKSAKQLPGLYHLVL